MIELRVSEAAALSIVEQADFYEQVSDVALAQRWEIAVDQSILSSVKLPGRGARCRFSSRELSDLLWIAVPGFPKHMVFYRYFEQENAIRIVQVLHGSRDLEILLDVDDQD